MAMNMAALPPFLPLQCTSPHRRPIHPKALPSFNKVFLQRCRAVVNADPSYIDYKSSSKSVFPAEACDTLGGDSCKGTIGHEVRPKGGSQKSKPSSEVAGVDAEYLEYDSNPKTVFPGEACDDLGGEFCEADYQAGVFQEEHLAAK